MFKKKIQDFIEQLTDQNTFDSSTLGDPLALQTEWTPAKRGGTNFKTHQLIDTHMNRLEFQASLGAKLFYIVFILIGVGIVLGFSISNFLSDNFNFNADTIFPILFGLVFAIVGSVLYYKGTIPIIFDKERNIFHKNRKAAHKLYRHHTISNDSIELDRIHALQLLSEYCSSSKTSYYSYELNLVLKNGERINVIDHGNKNKIREDTQTLSQFLEKPVWDGI